MINSVNHYGVTQTVVKNSLLSDNKYGSIGRVKSLVKNLRRTDKLEVYDSII